MTSRPRPARAPKVALDQAPRGARTYSAFSSFSDMLPGRVGGAGAFWRRETDESLSAVRRDPSTVGQVLQHLRHPHRSRRVRSSCARWLPAAGSRWIRRSSAGRVRRSSGAAAASLPDGPRHRSGPELLPARSSHRARCDAVRERSVRWRRLRPAASAAGWLRRSSSAARWLRRPPPQQGGFGLLRSRVTAASRLPVTASRSPIPTRSTAAAATASSSKVASALLLLSSSAVSRGTAALLLRSRAASALLLRSRAASALLLRSPGSLRRADSPTSARPRAAPAPRGARGSDQPSADRAARLPRLVPGEHPGRFLAAPRRSQDGRSRELR